MTLPLRMQASATAAAEQPRAAPTRPSRSVPRNLRQRQDMPFDVRSDIDRLPWRCAFHEPLALYLASIPGVSRAPNWHRRSGSEGAIYSRAPWRAGSGTNIAKVAGAAMLKPRQGDARSEKNTGAIKVEQAHNIGRSACRHSLKRVRTLVDI